MVELTGIEIGSIPEPGTIAAVGPGLERDIQTNRGQLEKATRHLAGFANQESTEAQQVANRCSYFQRAGRRLQIEQRLLTLFTTSGITLSSLDISQTNIPPLASTARAEALMEVLDKRVMPYWERAARERTNAHTTLRGKGDTVGYRVNSLLEAAGNLYNRLETEDSKYVPPEDTPENPNRAPTQAFMGTEDEQDILRHWNSAVSQEESPFEDTPEAFDGEMLPEITGTEDEQDILYQWSSTTPRRKSHLSSTINSPQEQAAVSELYRTVLERARQMQRQEYEDAFNAEMATYVRPADIPPGSAEAVRHRLLAEDRANNNAFSDIPEELEDIAIARNRFYNHAFTIDGEVSSFFMLANKQERLAKDPHAIPSLLSTGEKGPSTNAHILYEADEANQIPASAYAELLQVYIDHWRQHPEDIPGEREDGEQPTDMLRVAELLRQRYIEESKQQGAIPADLAKALSETIQFARTDLANPPPSLEEQARREQEKYLQDQAKYYAQLAEVVREPHLIGQFKTAIEAYAQHYKRNLNDLIEGATNLITFRHYTPREALEYIRNLMPEEPVSVPVAEAYFSLSLYPNLEARGQMTEVDSRQLQPNVELGFDNGYEDLHNRMRIVADWSRLNNRDLRYIQQQRNQGVSFGQIQEHFLRHDHELRSSLTTNLMGAAELPGPRLQAARLMYEAIQGRVFRSEEEALKNPAIRAYVESPYVWIPVQPNEFTDRNFFNTL